MNVLTTAFAFASLFQSVQEDYTTPPPLESESRGILLPGYVLYEPYLADPRQSRTGTKFQKDLDDEGHLKVENVLGLYQSLYRWQLGEGELEVAFEGASFSRFDVDDALDMDAADYRFGFPVIYRTGDVAVKVHPYHLTSHLGDEFIEDRDDVKRTDYHQEEIALGISWDASEHVRFYAEAGGAWMTSRPAKSGRVQVGAEWRGPELAEGTHPYVALDVQSRHEIDWDVNVTTGLGLLFQSPESPWRMQLGVEYYRGVDQQTQFLDDEQSYVGLLLSVELRPGGRAAETRR